MGLLVGQAGVASKRYRTSQESQQIGRQIEKEGEEMNAKQKRKALRKSGAMPTLKAIAHDKRWELAQSLEEDMAAGDDQWLEIEFSDIVGVRFEIFFWPEKNLAKLFATLDRMPGGLGRVPLGLLKTLPELAAEEESAILNEIGSAKTAPARKSSI